ncbi:MAG TPA: TetR family transcriptional regulator [Micrococcaceae bacterium]|jgi:AcrR family transcriptional regulator|nr:TetR family transcriptional regulator [Micrococcaceae bacterium]
MPRWEPDARQRLVRAALELFSEQTYDTTTVAQIADRAGLTRSTFFRYFPDKRDILTAGQETLARLFAEGIASAPAEATPLTAVAQALAKAAGVMTEFNREIGTRMQAVLASSAELRERDQLKHVGLAAVMADALVARGVARPVAALAGEMGLIAFRDAFAQWVNDDGAAPLAELLNGAMAKLRDARDQLG